MDLQIEKEKLKEFLSEKMNRRQLIVSGMTVTGKSIYAAGK